jgi:hypothetical protein
LLSSPTCRGKPDLHQKLNQILVLYLPHKRLILPLPAQKISPDDSGLHSFFQNKNQN